MMQSMFALTKRVLADEGHFVVIHTKDEMFGLREYVKYELLTYINSQVILCSTAAFYDMNEEVHILHMSRFKRDMKVGGHYNIEHFRGLRSKCWTPCRDYVEDNIKSSDWELDSSSKPWRGGAQRGKKSHELH
ncbi:hypothetical protein O6H91_03G059300 [Diphasiastrum complanatum]|uniref:Uncharacterized protein n=1 Tax=Diphasiastrum complanatum TaxID=34168 RepID=A0ACC2E6T0_DIPCM|nr:hypothetical protein O6H91_03G059300 [Diphasiastrum complanatum]